MKNLEHVLGVDVGGANTKFALLEVPHPREEKGKRNEFGRATSPLDVVPGHSGSRFLDQGTTFFPVWQKSLNELPSLLSEIRTRVEPKLEEAGTATAEKLKVRVTMTAELSDAYASKRVGVLHVAHACAEAFAGDDLAFLDVRGRFGDIQSVEMDPLAFAASNWVATARYVGELHGDGLLIDCGSTTTDVVPILDGMPATSGRDDTSRLAAGELVYTGLLRPPLATVSQKVPLEGRWVPVSFEKFACMADVYFLLGDLHRSQYTCETADGRPVTRENCLARVARVACGDDDGVDEEQVLLVCRHFKHEQLKMIRRGIFQVLSRIGRTFKDRGLDPVPTFLTGKGATVLEGEVGRWFPTRPINLDGRLGNEGNVASSAVAVAALQYLGVN